MTFAAALGPSWTDILTAIGTVGAVIVAVGIALWGERRSDKRVRDERTRSNKAIEDERAYGREQLEEERRIAREREQLAQAYAVQVVLTEQPAGGDVFWNDFTPARQVDGVEAEVKRLAVMVVNHGAYTITRVEAQFCIGNSMQQPRRYQRVTGFEVVPEILRAGFYPSPERPLRGVLTPFDEGIRFETDDIHEDHLVTPYPIIRWRDHWGTFWEHKRGVVRQVSESDPWQP